MGDWGGIKHDFCTLTDIRNRPLDGLPQEFTPFILKSFVIRSAANIYPEIIRLKEVKA